MRDLQKIGTLTFYFLRFKSYTNQISNAYTNIAHTIWLFFNSIFLLALFSGDYVPHLISHTSLWEISLRDFSLYPARKKRRLQSTYPHTYVWRLNTEGKYEDLYLLKSLCLSQYTICILKFTVKCHRRTQYYMKPNWFETII